MIHNLILRINRLVWQTFTDNYCAFVQGHAQAGALSHPTTRRACADLTHMEECVQMLIYIYLHIHTKL